MAFSVWSDSLLQGQFKPRSTLLARPVTPLDRKSITWLYLCPNAWCHTLTAPECQPPMWSPGLEGNHNQTQQLGFPADVVTQPEGSSCSVTRHRDSHPSQDTSPALLLQQMLSLQLPLPALAHLGGEFLGLAMALFGCQGSTQGQRHSTPHPPHLPHPTWRWELTVPGIP